MVIYTCADDAFLLLRVPPGVAEWRNTMVIYIRIRGVRGIPWLYIYVYVASAARAAEAFLARCHYGVYDNG